MGTKRHRIRKIRQTNWEQDNKIADRYALFNLIHLLTLNLSITFIEIEKFQL
jgi:hypothetical protein